MKRPRAFTLIELLIVVAIMAILTATMLLLLTSTWRIERATALQRETMEQLALLETTWRSDLHAAVAVPERAGEYTTGSAALILECRSTNADSSRTTYRIYTATGDSQNKLAVERICLASNGAVTSRQRLAASLDEATFTTSPTEKLAALTIDAKRGMQPHLSRQRYSLLSAIGGLQ